MIFDADQHVAAGTELNADICIIGSGAAGLCMAHSQIDSGRKIVVLESSRANRRISLSRTGLIELMERISDGSGALDHRFVDPDVQSLYLGKMVGKLSELDPTFLTRSRIRCYGGTTNCWGGWTRPLMPIDFDRSDLDTSFVWPIARQELHRFYNMAIRYCSLGEWDVDLYDNPTFWIDKTVDDIAPINLSRDSALQTGVIAVINNGPFADGRLDFQLVWGPAIEHADNVTIYRNANVRYIEANSGNASVVRLTASTVRNGKAGHDFMIRANHYVIAAGGIETARLLWVSNSLGNDSDHLGRYFMVHPLNEKAATFSGGRPPARSIVNYYSGATIRGGDWPASLIATLVPKQETLSNEKLGSFRAIINFVSGRINFNWEQIPNKNSRIMLDSSKDILFNDPRVMVDWRLASFDRRTLKKGLGLVLHELIECGYATEFTQNLTVERAGDHHMGTTRMSKFASEGVVNSNCRLHSTDNLWVASSSVFPTSGHANPTLTIIALALRLSEHLLSQAV